MCCLAEHSPRKQEPDPEEDEVVELENGEEHFPEVERDWLTGKD